MKTTALALYSTLLTVFIFVLFFSRPAFFVSGLVAGVGPAEGAVRISQSTEDPPKSLPCVGEIGAGDRFLPPELELAENILGTSEDSSESTLHTKAREAADRRHVADIAAVVPLTTAQRAQLESVVRQVRELAERDDLSDEEFDMARRAIPSEEDVIGEEAYNKYLSYLERSNEENERIHKLSEDREVVYLTKVLHLSPEQQDALLGSYENPERELEKEIAHTLSKLELPKAQSEKVEQILRKDYEEAISDFAKAYGGAANLPDEFTFIDEGERTPDDAAILRHLQQKELRKVLNDEQMNRYLEFESASGPPPAPRALPSE